MGTLLLIALNIGRQYSIAPALFFAALIMLVMNPKILFWDIGFQLSFAATLGIVYFAPLFEQRTEYIENPAGVKSVLITTFAAIIATLPFILLYFGRMSLVAPLANVLILPFLPYIMLWGFLTVVPVLGAGFAFITNFLLIYVLKVTSLLAGWKFSSLEVHLSALSFWSAIGLIFVLYYFLRQKTVKSKSVE